MPIQYALFENNLTADPDDYAATVQISGSADGDDLVQDIVDQGSTVGRPDILAVTAALKLACQRRVEQGQRVNYFGMMDFFPRIKGVFTGATDSFDPARHRVDVGANPGGELREAVQVAATVEKVEAVKPAPNPIEYRDVGSDTTNDTITAGNIGQLSGSRLKFDPAASDEGLYFVATGGGDYKVSTVQKNKPSQLVFLVPALVDGTYHLEVRARMGSGTSARELRIGRLDATLSAFPPS
ncbi:MAG: DUF4469 domain-containing protein [Candidatus Nealsonbacteria bacterium]|nr:DUF4469 domain-containing protein [Candidatus Nealsonbacteria bacterium]